LKDFFVSYNGADRQWAEWIAWQLEEAGFTTVLQDWDFSGNWILAMDQAMKETAHTIAVLSPNYLKALYTKPEWADAIRRDPTGSQNLLIPIQVERCELTGILANIVYVDLLGLDEPKARERLLARARNERGKPGMPPLFPHGTKSSPEGLKRPAYPLDGTQNVSSSSKLWDPLARFSRLFLTAIIMTAITITVFLRAYGEGVDNTEGIVIFFFWFVLAAAIVTLRNARYRKGGTRPRASEHR
jgi:hypothetical protein